MRSFLVISIFVVLLSGCGTGTHGVKNPKFTGTVNRVAIVTSDSGGRIQLTGSSGDVESTVIDHLTIEIIREGIFDLVERNDIDRLIKESNDSKIDFKAQGIDALMFVNASRYAGMYGTTNINLTVKLVDPATGNYIYTATAKTDFAAAWVGTEGESIGIAVNAIVNDLKLNFGSQ